MMRHKCIDNFGPSTAEQFRDYINAEIEWIKVEKSFLKRNLGHEPNSEELILVITQKNKGLMHRAWYLLRYPHKIIR